MKIRSLVGLILSFSLLVYTGDVVAKNINSDNEVKTVKKQKRYRQIVISRNIYSKEKGNSMKIKNKILIFTSESLGIIGKEDIYKHSDGIGRYVVVYNGVPADEDDNEGIARMVAESKRYKNGVNIIIAPNLFKKYNVTKVPTLIKLDENENLEAVVKGTTDLLAFEKMSEKFLLQTDFGKKGEVEEIVEPALTEEIEIE